MHKMKMKFIFIIAFTAISTTSFGQQKPLWEKWNWLMGEWAGEGSGKPGEGGGTFSFRMDLDENILVRKSHSEYVASENKPAVIHDDLMIVYPDANGNPAHAMYFDNEGHTIKYQISCCGKTIALTSDKIQNVPVFRLTYTLFDSNTVNTKFEMSQDRENFYTYIEGKRVKME